VMEAQACGHTLMSAEQRLAAVEEILPTIQLEDVNEMAKELCAHISHPDGVTVKPAAIVACGPHVDSRSMQEFRVTEAEVSSRCTVPCAHVKNHLCGETKVLGS